VVVIHEQHRFGVSHRQQIRSRNRSAEMPHLLSLTATPIPRSMALIVYGDLDVSLIKEKPLGRKPIITTLVNATGRARAYDFIHKQLAAGRQAFVVCPIIDPSDVLGVKSVTEEFARLQKEVFQNVSMAMLNGKMKPTEKEAVMRDFVAGKTKVLVSTSVIEVGIDVPNASIMLIEGAERFGLAQLHQFRGRVGRGADQSYCFVVPSTTLSSEALDRLKLLEEISDGFKLAEYDLQHRGPGQIYGVQQSGLPEFHFANFTNVAQITAAKEAVGEFLQTHTFADEPALKNKMEESVETVHLE